MDNQSRRSFASADVNTVICLFSAPGEERRSGLDEIARFVMFKTPFEGVLDPVIFEEVEEANERTSTEEHRIFPVSQRALLESGADYQTTDKSTTAKYTGGQVGREVPPRTRHLLDNSEEGKGQTGAFGAMLQKCVVVLRREQTSFSTLMPTPSVNGKSRRSS